MKSLFIAILMFTAVNAQAEITTKEQADQFINTYCITLVNEIEKAANKQTTLAEKEDWGNFMKTGTWISGLADIYSKLCR